MKTVYLEIMEKALSAYTPEGIDLLDTFYNLYEAASKNLHIEIKENSDEV